MIRHRLYTITLLALASVGYAAADTVVKVTDGDAVTAEFLLADTPEVKYADGSLTIHAGDVVVAYPADKTYTFTVTDGSGIIDAVATRIQIATDGGTLTVSCLPAGAPVSIYDMSGRLLHSVAADANGMATMAIDSHKGVIIVSLPDQSFKLIR